VQHATIHEEMNSRRIFRGSVRHKLPKGKIFNYFGFRIVGMHYNINVHEYHLYDTYAVLISIMSNPSRKYRDQRQLSTNYTAAGHRLGVNNYLQ
jgi:hypothetical protein